MGMDVYGNAPRTRAGAYFRANVWGWRPLASYIEELHPDLFAKAEYWYSNDGDGLDGDDAATLGQRIVRDLDTGRATAYLDQRDAWLADLDLEPCMFCDATGTRTDTLDARYPNGEPRTCNACEGTGAREPAARHYHLDTETLAEFAEFCLHSGGFSIT